MLVPEINLLPIEEKKLFYQKIAQEKATRFVLTLALYLVIFALAIFGAKLYLDYQQKILQSKISAFEISNVMRKIRENQQKIKVFNEMMAKTANLNIGTNRLIKQLEDLLNITPDGISFKSVTIEQGKVQIVGTAQTRQHLNDFKSLIEQIIKPDELIFPLSNLESPTDAAFELTYQFNKNKENLNEAQH